MKSVIQQDKRVLFAGGLVLFAFLSFFVFSGLPIIHSLNEQVIAELNEKQATVTALTAATATTSVGVGLIPGAEALSANIADLGDHLLLVLGSIWLQKYLMSLASALTFKLFYPLASFLLAVNLFWKQEKLKQLGIKLFLLGTVFFTVIPMSVAISQHIERTHEVAVKESLKRVEADQGQQMKKLKKNKSLLDKAKEAVGKIADTFDETLDNAKVTFSNMIDAVAVLIITTCVIPLLVLVSFIWILNLIFGLNFSMPSLKAMKGSQRALVSKKSPQ